MAKYFDKFPKIAYDIAGKQYTNYQVVTNLFYRLAIVREALNNISAYYNHIVEEHQTPEILAEQIYNDAEAHWIILMTNNIVDPQYDWPLDSRSFQKYIIDKYGSLATAKTTYHHYEKVVTREESSTGLVTETRFIVNEEKLTDNALDVPYDYYTGTGSLPETQSVNTYNMSDGKSVVEIINRNAVSYYDYENNLNEEKRRIKIIKPEYVPQIKSEFNALTRTSQPSYIRRLT